MEPTGSRNSCKVVVDVPFRWLYSLSDSVSSLDYLMNERRSVSAGAFNSLGYQITMISPATANFSYNYHVNLKVTGHMTELKLDGSSLHQAEAQIHKLLALKDQTEA